MKRLARRLLSSVLIAAALASPALAVDAGSVAEIIQKLQARVATACDCCRVPRGMARRLCVRRLVKQAVRQHRLARILAARAIRLLATPCTPEAVAFCNGVPTTTLPSRCTDDASCDDGNGCTMDQCIDGRCAYVCRCLLPTGDVSCCPGPAASCSRLRYFSTCGDPVCAIGGHRDHPGVAPCTDQRAGAPCTLPGETCDPGSDCNQLLECATAGPTMCPISRRSYKDDITYLTDADRRQLLDELLRMNLARYRYRGEDASTPTHLGFIIDDVGPSPAVNPDGDHVDVYGYASMAVAAIQQQAREIERLRREVAQLRQRLDQRGDPPSP